MLRLPDPTRFPTGLVLVLPNWIIAGAPKAATSSLFRWLVDHPEVAGSLEKETYYFADAGTHMFRSDRNFASNGLAGYQSLFEEPGPSTKVILESTPSYLYSETALRELPDLPSQPSFIFVLREPVAQLRSLFAYFQQNWNWIPRQMNFGEFILAVEEERFNFKGNELARDALRNAWYPQHLLRWRRAVGERRMLVLLFDDLVTDNRGTLKCVAERLGISPSFYDGYDFPPENQTYIVRNGPLQDLNIVIRKRLPQGRIYDAFRSLYRAVNTRRPGPQAVDPAIGRRLAEKFLPMVSELEREFSLDMTRWRAVLDGHMSHHERSRSGDSTAVRIASRQGI